MYFKKFSGCEETRYKKIQNCESTWADFYEALENIVPRRPDWLQLPLRRVIRTPCTLLSGSITQWIFECVLSFHCGAELHWNGVDQPEHRCQSHPDLLIPDASGNIIIIKSLPPPSWLSQWLNCSWGYIILRVWCKLRLRYFLKRPVPASPSQMFSYNRYHYPYNLP